MLCTEMCWRKPSWDHISIRPHAKQHLGPRASGLPRLTRLAAWRSPVDWGMPDVASKVASKSLNVTGLESVKVTYLSLVTYGGVKGPPGFTRVNKKPPTCCTILPFLSSNLLLQHSKRTHQFTHSQNNRKPYTNPNFQNGRCQVRASSSTVIRHQY